MDSQWTNNGGWLSGGIVAFVVLGPLTVYYYTQRSLYRQSESKKEQWATFKRDVVYLHMFPRRVAKQVPNLSPFAMKLEMWLRVKKIPYEVIETLEWSSKRQSPYIVLNREEIADTNFIIDRLTNHFDLDTTEGLDEETQGASRAFLHLVEGSFVWTYFLWRYTENRYQFAKVFRIPLWKPVAHMIRYFMANGMRKRCYQIGIGRHTSSEINQIAEADMTAISRYLGTKPYFCGNRPTMIDCCLFGHLSQVIHVLSLEYPQRTYLNNSCSNVMEYIERLKSEYWKDWEDIVNKGEFT